MNEKILAGEVRVVDEEGKMAGILPTAQALRQAQDKGLDLVEMSGQAKPPTCKIMDYGKWKFKMSKKEKTSRKNQVKIIIKEVQIRPRTDVHDFNIKMKKAKEFLMKACKVKIHLRFSGREMAHKELGFGMLEKVKKELLPYSALEKEAPQVERRSMFLFFAPDPAKIKEQQKIKKAGGSDSGGSSNSADSGSDGGSRASSAPAGPAAGSAAGGGGSGGGLPSTAAMPPS